MYILYIFSHQPQNVFNFIVILSFHIDLKHLLDFYLNPLDLFMVTIFKIHFLNTQGQREEGQGSIQAPVVPRGSLQGKKVPSGPHLLFLYYFKI